MASQSQARCAPPPPPLTEEELADGFHRMAVREWRAKEARPFTRRLKAVPSLAAPFLVERLTAGDERERQLASLLLGQLEGPRVIAPLRDLLRNLAAPNMARATAAVLLENLGEATPIHLVATVVQNPDRFIDETWDEVFRQAQHEESFREQFLADFERDSRDSQGEMLELMARTRDPRALTLLLPLLYSRRVTTVTGAIKAIDALGDAEAAPALQERAKGDPNTRVRRLAREAYGRLLMRANPLLPEMGALLRLAPAPPPPLPVHRACVTLLDRHGDQAILVSRRRPEGFLKVVTVLVSDAEGIKTCHGVDMMQEQELAEMAAELARNGLTPVEVELARCRQALAAARRVSVERRRRPPMELEIWRGLIEPASEAPATEPPPDEASNPDWTEYLHKTGALLSAPEFRQWFFDPGSVWPYVDEWCTAPLEAQQSDEGRKTLEKLVGLAAADLVTLPVRELLSKRLERQSWLLGRLGKHEVARLASAAAHALHPHKGVPAEHHPFVRAMVLSSFLNAGLRPPQDTHSSGR